MGTPVSIAKATRELELAASGKPNQAWKVWPLLPGGLPVDLVRRAMKKVLKDDHSVGVVGRSLADEYFQSFLERVIAMPPTPLAIAARSLQHVESKRRERLGEVLKSVSQLGVFSASTSQLQARARTFAKNADLVEAARQILLLADREAYWPYHRLMLVSVLMEDATDASMDVLIAEAHAALSGPPDEVDLLRECVRWRKPPKPALRPLIELLDSTASAAGGSASLPQLAKAIGLSKVPRRLSATFTLGLDDVDLRVELDDSQREWWLVELHRRVDRRPIERIVFGPERREGRWKGAPRLADLTAYAAWLSALKRFLKTKKSHRPWLSRCSLRGSDRERLVRWLSGFDEVARRAG